MPGQGPLQLLSSPFLMTSTTKQMRLTTERGWTTAVTFCALLPVHAIARGDQRLRCLWARRATPPRGRSNVIDHVRFSVCLSVAESSSCRPRKAWDPRTHSLASLCLSVSPLSLSVLTAIFPGEPGLPVLLELRMMEMVVTTGAIRRAKLLSNYHHQQSNTQRFTGRNCFF